MLFEFLPELLNVMMWSVSASSASPEMSTMCVWCSFELVERTISCGNQQHAQARKAQARARVRSELRASIRLAIGQRGKQRRTDVAYDAGVQSGGLASAPTLPGQRDFPRMGRARAQHIGSDRVASRAA